MNWDSPWYPFWYYWMVPLYMMNTLRLRILPGSLGVACPPILSVSLEEVGCEPVLNLAATPDEAVSIICTVCWQKYTFNFLGEVYVCELYYWPARVFSRASCRCSSYNLSVGSSTWLTYALWDVLSRWQCSWRVLTPPMCMPLFLDWALQLMYVHNQLMIIVSSSMVAMLGMGAGPSKLW